MKKIAIGQIDCHICGLDAEVKISDKSGLAFTFCPDCNVQSFCRNKSQHEKLIGKMRPVTVTAKNADIEPLADVVLPPVKEKKTGFSLGDL